MIYYILNVTDSASIIQIFIQPCALVSLKTLSSCFISPISFEISSPRAQFHDASSIFVTLATFSSALAYVYASVVVSLFVVVPVANVARGKTTAATTPAPA